MTDVLVIGAGPTGLTAALELARRGVHVRIIDRSDGPFEGSRGKGVTARTQEVFDDLGIADRLVESGFRHLPVRVTSSGEIRSDEDPLAAAVPTADRPYESGLLLPQWRTEQILRDRLGEFGIHVEYGLAATSVEQQGEHVEVTSGGTAEQVRYVIACTGGRSDARDWIGATFEGHGGPQALLIADVRVDGLTPDRWYQWNHPERGFVALCPFRCTDIWQFQGALWSWFVDGTDLPEPSLPRLQDAIDTVAGDGIRLSAPAWTSRWRVNVRLADRFRSDRVFLAGDAAHVHSPAGGLGMNTGIQDAYNLGWKIAAVLAGADAALLDTYAEERIPVAQWTLGVSNRGLEEMAGNMTSADATHFITPQEDGQQLAIGYRWSRLSVETDGFAARGGPLRAGDRAPDGAYGRETFFDAFRGPHATVIAVGTDEPLPSPTERLAVLRTPSAPTYTPTDGLFVVRPDGYVGFAGVPGDGSALREYAAVFA
ncbi:FAD-dependent oxidoreductase [Tsukamurella sp. 8F]|nr:MULTISPECIES: FAD-dependent oxidoreductase [unclassified Tsukamurella]MDF0530115.1 FAD-dependent oxidoreductase [Tsukamurella sp. 8J]MDF0586433.1 FAD-dependent oxidoreductase [Tsukamurella sp. 8F]